MIRLKERRDKRLAHADAGILPNEFKDLLWGEVVDCVDALHSHYASLASALGFPAVPLEAPDARNHTANLRHLLTRDWEESRLTT